MKQRNVETLNKPEYLSQSEAINDKDLGLFDEELDYLDDADIEMEQDGDVIAGAIYTQDEWKELMCKANSNNTYIRNEAKEMIYKAMLPFIKYLASKYYPTYFVKYGEDLTQAGSVGLFESMEKYDPEKGKPTTWCFRSIIHEMREFIVNEVHHTTPHYQTHLRDILHYINDCKIQGIPYTIDDIIIATGFPRPTIVNCIAIYERNQNQVSIEQSFGEGGSVMAESLIAPIQDPEAAVLEREQLRRLLQLMMEVLTEPERMVLMLHHGFYDEVPKSAAEIAELLHLKKQSIRPLMNMAEHKLRKAMKNDPMFSSEKKERKNRNGAAILFFREESSLTRELDSLEFDDAVNW